MKTTIRTQLSVLALALLAACSNQEAAKTETPAKSTPEATSSATPSAAPTATDASVVKVAISGDYRPFSFYESQKAQGIEVELLQKVAEKQGFKVEFNTTVWSKAYQDVKNKTFDVIAMGTAVDEADTSVVVPTSTYMRSGDCVATLHDKKLPDWTKGRVTVADDETMKEEVMKANGIPAEKISMEKNSFLTLTALVKDKADAAVGDCSVLKYYSKGDTLKSYTFNIVDYNHAGQTEESFAMTLMVSKDKPDLVNKINAGIVDLKQSGELDALVKKHTNHGA
ncbi:transporter substrate-binding domain-containing protein [Kingella negevensis]|uniref:substrate-binding periplasmic protein n=1 Tax=Kingella negevensis TaxID=1522312 RepID=UPI0025433AC1|nr:transporter substrate-binding domain-containing protein [Kingella negevensis]WII94228.1 transporter substrate-binding domain-containing protein [Kingella negevensis]